MDVSTRNHQVHPENLFKFDEMFTAAKTFCSNRFGKKEFFWAFAFLRKTHFLTSENLV